MTTLNKWAAIPIACILMCACSKKNNAPASDIKQDTVTVESIIKSPPDNQLGDIDPNRKGFIDLYDGVAYSQTEAAAASSRIDFAYNYHGGGCNTCRFFENVEAMSTRTYYVESFSTITASQMTDQKYGNFVMTDKQFDSLRTAADIDNYFSAKKLETRMTGGSDITDRKSDAIVSRFYAFIDKNGKKGFFKISDYIANPPNGSPTPITLYIKIQK